jgi:hypothetical protein
LWKIALVTPLYKADDKLLVENYPRPISILPVLSKVLENVVHTGKCHIGKLSQEYFMVYRVKRFRDVNEK